MKKLIVIPALLLLALMLPAAALASNHNGSTPPSIRCNAHLIARGVSCKIAEEFVRKLDRTHRSVVTIRSGRLVIPFHWEKTRFAHGHAYYTYGVSTISVTIVGADTRG